MRIIIVPKSYPAMAPFGSLRPARCLALALQQLGADVEVVTADVGPETSSYHWDTVVDTDGTVVTRCLAGTVVSPRQVIWRALESREPCDAVVITQPGHFGQAAITAAHHWGVPALVHVSGLDVFSTLFDPFFAPFLIWTLGKAAAVTAATGSMAALAAPFAPGPVAVWPEPHLTGADLPDRAAIATAWALPESPLRIGLLGPFSEFSGLQEALAAFGLLYRQFPQATLVVSGTVPVQMQHHLDAWQRSDPNNVARLRIVPAAEDDDLAALCRACDQIWLPWHAVETTAPVSAAMAAGVPVIATRLPPLSEMVSDGVTGLLVPPGDGYALADSAGRLAADPIWAKGLGLAAKARWSEVAGFDRFRAAVAATLQQVGVG